MPNRRFRILAGKFIQIVFTFNFQDINHDTGTTKL